jgi:hypothetical protein
MALLNRISTVANSVLSHIGLRVSRARPSSSRHTSETQTIGRFELTLPSKGHLGEIYRQFPGYNSELGRIGKLTHPKYAQLKTIDIGANIGDTIAIARSQFSAPILAIEGDPETFDLLRKNTTQFEQVEILQTFPDERAGRSRQSCKTRDGTPALFPLKPGAFK